VGSSEKTRPLYEKNIYPPLSILNQDTGFWKARKKEWLNLGIESELGREGVTAFNMGNGWMEDKDIKGCVHKHISIFDPFLCELAYQWFSPRDGVIFDPFAGGSVRGIVSSYLDRKYIGIDLSEKQIEANKKQLNIVDDKQYKPTWICDDAMNMDNHISDNSVDFMFSCPPYHDLEIYTDNKKDLSNMDYDSFLHNYGNIISNSYSKLKDNRFAGFVVTELREQKSGGYKNFLSDTISCFEDAGYTFYNDMIIMQTIGSKALIAQRSWDINRKITRRHQNFLVFIKGDGKLAKQDMTEIEKIDLTNNNSNFW
tara:strand:- start:455 stop:1390 length:936 start_codon:yes stop_codon:yes gene_type:complete